MAGVPTTALVLAQHPDFVAVFGSSTKYVVEETRATRCKEFELSHDNTVYRVAMWKPLSPNTAGGNAVVSYAQKPLNTVSRAYASSAGQVF